LAFTTHFPGVTSALVTDAHITKPFSPDKNQQPENPVEFKALWDTGATNSLITQSVVEKCDLKPIGMTRVGTAVGQTDCAVFLVGMRLPNNVWFPQIRVTLGQLTSGIDILVGMDVIHMGDFAITHRDEKTAFSFRVPSIDCIDFVQHPNPFNPRQNIGRNDLCYCGSGKKYKHCHGKAVS
ncbi:SEC-C domain-containing protein, partial [candidate division KSB1 bacterium]|nr:SEC-C domain-containing protein [candidate division KSB1 bacterium]